MAWPNPQDYSEAVQNPSLCFIDNDLRSGVVEVDALGLPRPIAGGFAVVYRVKCGSKSYAVRCFLSEITDLKERYSCIESALRTKGNAYFVPFSFILQGIKVSGKWYPVLKMEWADGDSLMEYVRRSLNSPSVLKSLAQEWEQMCLKLRDAGIAHGDLQHGNVLVRGGQILLIDYDGMFVPSLRGKSSSELGHRHYQHPKRRAEHFDSTLDFFSAWVIYGSLLAFSIDPSLWDKVSAGDEWLLFQREDYEHPATSRTLQRLATHPDERMRQLGTVVSQIVTNGIRDVPFLDSMRLENPNVKTLPGDGSWLIDIIGSHVPPVSQPPTSIQVPTLAPSLNWWETEYRKEPAESFGDHATIERVALICACLLSLFPVFLTGLSGGVLTFFSLPILFFVWRGWVITRFKRHPVTLKLQHLKEQLPDPEVLASNATKLRREWDDCETSIATLKRKMTVITNDATNAKTQIESVQEKAMAGLRSDFLNDIARCETALNEILALEKIESDRIIQASDPLLSLFSANIQGVRLQLDTGLQSSKSKLKRLNSELAGLTAFYSSKTTKAEADFKQKESAIEQELLSMRSSVQNKLNQELATLQRNSLEAHLRGRLIINASIVGIGPALEERLAAFGIERASDISLAALTRVPGIGPQKRQALLSWRTRMVAEGSGKPSRLPADMEAAIRDEIRTKEQQLLKTLVSIRQERQSFRALEAEAERNHRASLMQQRQAEESQVAAQEHDLRSRFCEQESQLEAQLQAERQKRDKALEDISTQFRGRRSSLMADRNYAEGRFNERVRELTQNFTVEFINLEKSTKSEFQVIDQQINDTIDRMNTLAESIKTQERQVAEIQCQLDRFSRTNARTYLRETLLLPTEKH